jgi:hypothetical protein
MDSILDAEMSWKEFVDSSTTTEENDYRSVRINPNIGFKPPSLDATDELQPLREATKKSLKKKKSTIQDVARLLISSSFYFDMTTAPSAEGATGFKCRGKQLMKSLFRSSSVEDFADFTKVKFSVDLRAMRPIYELWATFSYVSRDQDISLILRYLRTVIMLPSNR